jgi:hypothetical protein
MAFPGCLFHPGDIGLQEGYLITRNPGPVPGGRIMADYFFWGLGAAPLQLERQRACFIPYNQDENLEAGLMARDLCGKVLIAETVLYKVSNFETRMVWRDQVYIF